MNASIINIGNELLSGLIVNTNASYIAQLLDESGIDVKRIDTIADNVEEINEALDYHLQLNDLLIITGGLGPTNDDITKLTLADKFGMKLVFHQPSFDNVQRMFANRGIEVSETNRQQAFLPDGCIPLLNTQGTAPGMWFEIGDKVIIAIPGVPFEMKILMQEEIIPRLQSKVGDRIIVRKMFYTSGVAESNLQDLLSAWEATLPKSVQLAYLPEPGVVKLRLSIWASNKEEGTESLKFYSDSIKNELGPLIYGEDEDTLASVVGKMLSAKGKTLSVAESCTGGNVAHLLTTIPGCSSYFKGGVVSYANEVKSEVLGVDSELIAKHGAVSEEVVKEMALHVKELLKTDYAIATSGIAGPEGGSVEKPVGTIWIAVATPKGVEAKRFNFGEHRQRNITRSSFAALNELRMSLLE